MAAELLLLSLPLSVAMVLSVSALLLLSSSPTLLVALLAMPQLPAVLPSEGALGSRAARGEAAAAACRVDGEKGWRVQKRAWLVQQQHSRVVHGSLERVSL